MRILSTNLDLQGISLLRGKSILNCSGSENIEIFFGTEKGYITNNRNPLKIASKIIVIQFDIKITLDSLGNQL